jgi:hypothetical protein
MAIEHFFGPPGLVHVERVEGPVWLLRGYRAPVAPMREDGFPRQRWDLSMVATCRSADTAGLHLLPHGATRPWLRLVFRAVRAQGFRAVEWEQEKGHVLVPVRRELK